MNEQRERLDFGFDRQSFFGTVRLIVLYYITEYYIYIYIHGATTLLCLL